MTPSAGAATPRPGPTLLVHAYLDGELDLANALVVKREIEADPALASELANTMALRKVLRERYPREPVPTHMRSRIDAAIGLRHRWTTRPTWRALAASVVLAVALSSGSTWLMLRSPAGGRIARDDDTAVAESLAAMLRSGRTVISRHQAKINDPEVGDKGLNGKSVLAEAVRIYQETTGADPLAIDPDSRQGRLLRAQMDAIVEVIESNRDMLDKKGVGFKGFIPATFGRLVNEAFSKRASNQAEVKVTAPLDLVRNPKARPDAWEAEVISAQLLSASWPKGQVYSAVTDSRGRLAFRIAVPEYYVPSCLSCHGGPKGEIDLTGYPKEGRLEGDLGGVISITLYR
jgi:hypothetical protein